MNFKLWSIEVIPETGDESDISMGAAFSNSALEKLAQLSSAATSSMPVPDELLFSHGLPLSMATGIAWSPPVGQAVKINHIFIESVTSNWARQIFVNELIICRWKY